MENKKKEIKHIRNLIVEKQMIDFENLIIHKNTFKSPSKFYQTN